MTDASCHADQWKPLNLEEKKRYDREFLLGFQFIFASMQKPEGLPHITDVVLDKVGVLRKEVPEVHKETSGTLTHF